MQKCEKCQQMVDDDAIWLTVFGPWCVECVLDYEGPLGEIVVNIPVQPLLEADVVSGEPCSRCGVTTTACTCWCGQPLCAECEDRYGTCGYCG